MHDFVFSESNMSTIYTSTYAKAYRITVASTWFLYTEVAGNIVWDLANGL